MKAFEKEKTNGVGPPALLLGGEGLAHDEDYEMFKIMMKAFEKEQEQTKGRYEDLQRQLAQNIEKLMELQIENQKLEKEMDDIICWEPDIT
mmetsp:Transcript_33494/g.52382  ORF Transcript_33494/g.52382 Transcript_33494/m.52382 type:complete len:91 (-) Transcript_33494:35-307(-)